MGPMISKLNAQAPPPQSTADPSNNPGKIRDLFALTNNLAPETFKGPQVHVLSRVGAPWKTSNISPPPPTPTSGGNDADQHRWSAISILKWKSGSPWLSAGYNLQLPHVGSASLVTELDMISGRWNFETVGQLDDGKLDVWLAGYFSQLKRLSTLRIDVDYKSPGVSLSVNVNPTLKETAVQCLKAVSPDLSVGVELALKIHDDGRTTAQCHGTADPRSSFYRPAVMAKYVGPMYQISGKFRPMSRDVSLAYYHHINEKLQAGVTFTMNPSRSRVVTRLMYRALTDTSVFRATVGTDGAVGSLWEKRLSDRLAISTSFSINHVLKIYEMGIGLSFDWRNL